MKALALITLAGILATQAVKADPSDLPEARALDSYRDYWEGFDRYERDQLTKERDQIVGRWKDLQKQRRQTLTEINREEETLLDQSIDKYRQLLSTTPEASNRPFVLLNLARLLKLAADHSKDREGQYTDAAMTKLDEARGYLSELEKAHRDFIHNDASIYLLAQVCRALSDDGCTKAQWLALTAKTKPSIYQVHAFVALGDQAFTTEDVSKSLSYYKNAKLKLNKIITDDLDFEALRLDYRLAWASLRAGELSTAIDAGLNLLKPGRYAKDINTASKMQQDAIDIVANALFLKNDVRYSEAILAQKDLRPTAPRIAQRLALQYSSNRAYTEAINILQTTLELTPFHPDLPTALDTLAQIHHDKGQAAEKIIILERLANLLPAQSLWRSKNQENGDAIRHMEQVATRATMMAADFAYQEGSKSGVNKFFANALGLYDILLEAQPNHPESDRWRLKAANSCFFLGQLLAAEKRYDELRKQRKPTPDIFELASYQFALVQERQWREAMALASQTGKDPLQDSTVLARLSTLDQAVVDFANRFPTRPTAPELLLVAASAQRDHQRWEQAEKYWQRILAMNTAAPQRTIALRGLVSAKIAQGQTSEVIQIVQQFLRLEDWKALGPGLDTELKGVLSQATLDEGDALSKKGEVLTSGLLMVTVAREFKDLPHRDRIFRDGGYLLAIGGDWYGAQKAAETYLNEKLKREEADMLYLLARSYEYQLRFPEAAQNYLSLALRYPNHLRSSFAAKRSETLALGEGLYSAAAEAALVSASLEKDRTKSRDNIQRALDHYDKAKDWNGFSKAADTMARSSRTPYEKIRGQMLLGDAMEKRGRGGEALKVYQSMNRSLPKQRRNLSETEYAEVAGVVSLKLGNESLDKFNDYNINDREGTVSSRIARKTRYFDEMVSTYTPAMTQGTLDHNAESRYKVAEAAASFADQLQIALANNPSIATERQNESVASTINRLRDFSKQQFAKNVALKRTQAVASRNNEWIKRSSVKLFGIDKNDVKGAQGFAEYAAPEATADTLPMEWSL